MTLLMADDDWDDREIMNIAFQNECAGHNLEFVCNGEELLKFLRNQLAEDRILPDLIVLDLNMPKVDGKQALKEIKEDAALRHIPVVVYSTSDSKEDRSHALAMGAREYITKPIGYYEMLRVCRLICEQATMVEA